MIQPRRRKRDHFLPWAQIIVDIATLYACLYFVFWLRFESGYFANLLSSSDHPIYFRTFHLIVFIFLFFLRFYGLYRPINSLTFAEESWKVMKAALAGTLVLMAMSFFVRGFSFSRTYLTLTGCIMAPAISLMRYVLGLVVMWIDRVRGSFRNILVVGIDPNVSKLIDHYKRNPRFATKVVGFLDDAKDPGTLVYGVPVLGPLANLGEMLHRDHQIHEVVLAGSSFSSEEVLKVLYECEKEMVSFRWLADMFGLITAKMRISYVASVPVLSFMDSPLADWENRVLKRSLDLILTLMAFVLFIPVCMLIAAAIKFSSKGPIFFKQERVGQDGRHFMLYKFRTMREDAESDTGPVWTKENDERRTPIGSFLRRNNLDELPQLWNVLMGDMSLVGPRPERPFFASQFKEDIPRYMARHSIRSGLSGWAQVHGLRGNTSIEERTKYDLYYIENWSLLLDIRILFMTLFARRNAY